MKSFSLGEGTCFSEPISVLTLALAERVLISWTNSLKSLSSEPPTVTSWSFALPFRLLVRGHDGWFITGVMSQLFVLWNRTHCVSEHVFFICYMQLEWSDDRVVNITWYTCQPGKHHRSTFFFFCGLNTGWETWIWFWHIGTHAEIHEKKNLFWAILSKKHCLAHNVLTNLSSQHESWHGSSACLALWSETWSNVIKICLKHLSV